MSNRTVPDGWVEFTAAFLDEISLGIHAGWQLSDDPGMGGEIAVYFPPDGGEPQAWAVRRNRILGSPVPMRARTPR